MASSQRENAQHKRAEARNTRRNQSEDGEQLGLERRRRPVADAFKQAAKVAAASAAVGALAAAARVLSQRRKADARGRQSRKTGGRQPRARRILQPTDEREPEERPSSSSRAAAA